VTHCERKKIEAIRRNANPYLQIQDGLDDRGRLNLDTFSSDPRERGPFNLLNTL